MDWIKRLFTDYLAGWLLVITPLFVGFLAWIQSLPYYVIALATLFAFGAIFWGINQFHVFRERRRKGLSSRSDKEIEDVIRNWLDDPGYKFQRKDINDPLFHNDRLFHFEVEDEWGRVISIARPRAKPTRLDLASAVFLSSEHKKMYEELNPDDKNNLVHNLRVEMARIGVLFKGIETSLNRVDIGDSVSLDDNLTEFYLKQRILFMIRATFLLNELIIQGLNL